MHRNLLAVAILGVVSGLVPGYLTGYILRPNSDARFAGEDPRYIWAKRVAEGPMPELLSSATGFLAFVEARGGDQVIWAGVQRLVEAALRSKEPLLYASGGQTLAERLVLALRSKQSDLTPALRNMLVDLERMAVPK